MNDIRKLLLAKKALPEGYGRSVVGGRELITAPSKRKVIETGIDDDGKPYSLTEDDFKPFDLELDTDVEGIKNEAMRESSGYVPDLSQSFEPDSKGLVGDYHADDLMEQYAELKANSTPEEMDAMVTDMDMVNAGIYKSKYQKNGSNYSPGEEEEAIRMLGTSIKYGRGR